MIGLKTLDKNINIYKKQIFSEKVIKKTMDCYDFLIENDPENKEIYEQKMKIYLEDIKKKNIRSINLNLFKQICFKSP